MKRTFGAVVVLLAAAACARDGVDAKPRDYEVVQEGSASGVTTTIQGPGEALPPITGTNADTTTAFTLSPDATAGMTDTAHAGETTSSAYNGTVPSYAPPPASAPVGASPAATPAPAGIASPRTTTVAPAMTPRRIAPPPARRETPPPPPPQTAPEAEDEEVDPPPTESAPPAAEKPAEDAPPPSQTDTSNTEEPPPPPPGS